MSLRSRSLPVALLTLITATPLAAQTGPQTADDKEVYAYVLTMDGLRKVLRATGAMIEEMKKDPTYRQIAALEAEIKSLEDKGEKADDGLSEADEERLTSLREKHEKLEESVEKSNPMNAAKTLSEMEAAARKTPALGAALQREGLSLREYAKFWIAFWSTGFAHALQKQGQTSKELTSVVNPVNLKFFAEHEKEIEALIKEHEFVKPK